MKRWKIRFTSETSRLLFRLHPENKQQIKRALIELRQDPYVGKNLQQELSGFKSFRLKQYRFIYDLNEEENYIQIYNIGRRSDVYDQFRRMLSELQKASR